MKTTTTTSSKEEIKNFIAMTKSDVEIKVTQQRGTLVIGHYGNQPCYFTLLDNNTLKISSNKIPYESLVVLTKHNIRTNHPEKVAKRIIENSIFGATVPKPKIKLGSWIKLIDGTHLCLSSDLLVQQYQNDETIIILTSKDVKKYLAEKRKKQNEKFVNKVVKKTLVNYLTPDKSKINEIPQKLISDRSLVFFDSKKKVYFDYKFDKSLDLVNKGVQTMRIQAIMKSNPDSLLVQVGLKKEEK
jgi:hypothetical protein